MTAITEVDVLISATAVALEEVRRVPGLPLPFGNVARTVVEGVAAGRVQGAIAGRAGGSPRNSRCG